MPAWSVWSLPNIQSAHRLHLSRSASRDTCWLVTQDHFSSGIHLTVSQGLSQIHTAKKAEDRYEDDIRNLLSSDSCWCFSLSNWIFPANICRVAETQEVTDANWTVRSEHLTSSHAAHPPCVITTLDLKPHTFIINIRRHPNTKFPGYPNSECLLMMVTVQKGTQLFLLCHISEGNIHWCFQELFIINPVYN